MAEHDLDHQFPPPDPDAQPVAVLALYRRPGVRILAPPPARASWMLRGACRSEDPELFFPRSPTGPSLAQVNSAKAICGRCPVQPNCLSYALITQRDGIWGGTTREERTEKESCRGGRSTPAPR
jgi:WhiB family transcriptional regulator, redox-sensing transcriptional regulator